MGFLKRLFSKQTGVMEQYGVSGFGDNWKHYMYDIESPFHVCYDATVKQLPEDVRKEYPNTLELEIPFTETNNNRYPPKSEMERIYNICENMSCGNYHVRMIGITMGGSSGWIAFCCDVKGKKVKKLIDTLMHGSGCTKCSYTLYSNDHFAYYNTLLAFPLYENNWIMNRTTCDSLTEKGEAFKEPREIEFLCCFSSTQHIQRIADQLADRLSEHGFHEIGREKAESGEYWLRFNLEGIPSLLWINMITCGIIHLLEGIDGYFDGWGCIVKDDNA